MAARNDPPPQSDSDALDAGLEAGWGAARDAGLDVRTRAASPSALPQGRGSYELFGEIARGGMGVVLRGRDANFGRDVALKVLREDLAQRPEVFRRFIEEAQIAGQLQHPGIVPVYDLGLMADARPYFAMKLVEGRTLAALLAERALDERRKLLDVFEDVCQAVAYAHSRRVVHRDLKPANVLIGAFGEVQVVDWGLAKVLGAPQHVQDARADAALGATLDPVRTGSSSSGSPSLAGSVMGTPAYMPPEQARGEIEQLDERSDVFALGAMLCEILTGSPPYEGESQSAMQQAAAARLDDARQRLDACGADAELVELCKLCMQPRRADRPRSAAIVAERVHAYLAAVEERARSAQVRAAEARVRSRAIALFSAAGFVLLASGVGGWLWMHEQNARRSRETDSAVAASLQDATLARGRQNWSAAQAELERARARLERGDASDAMREQVASLGAAIDQEARTASEAARLAADNSALLAQLQDVRLPEGDRIYPTNWAELDRRYGEIAAAHDLLVDVPSIEDAALALGARGISVELASELDEWASVRRKAQDQAGADHLSRVADALDREPGRQRLRAALLAKDVAALRAIAASEAVDTLEAPSLRLLAVALLDGSQVEVATDVLLAARRRFPQDFTLATECARALRRCKPARSEAAVANYEAALAMRPTSLEAWHELGQTLANELKRGADALVLFRSALARAPEDAHLQFHVGHALTMVDKHADAIEIYRRSLALDPRQPLALCDLGISLDTLGRTAEAVESFQRATELDPSFALAHYNLGVSLVTLGRGEEAVASYQRALASSGKDAPLNFSIGGGFVGLRRYDEALASYRRAVEADPKNAQSHFYVGWTLNHLGRDREALEAVQRALQLRPTEAGWYRFVAWVLATTEDDQLRDPAGAIANARRAVALAPNKGDYSGVLGVAQYVSGDFHAARDSIQHGIELAGEDEVRLLFLSLCAARLGDADGARDSFERVEPNLDPLLATFPALKRFAEEARAVAAGDG